MLLNRVKLPLGMSYGNWIATWTNWLFSGVQSEYNGSSDMLFLRGYFGYNYNEATNTIQNIYEYDYKKTVGSVCKHVKRHSENN